MFFHFREMLDKARLQLRKLFGVKSGRRLHSEIDDGLGDGCISKMSGLGHAMLYILDTSSLPPT